MSSEAFQARLVKVPKLADVVARDLRTWIVRGTLKEGDELPTLERLAAQFGVSLAVVREAVRILETEDLLEIRRGAKGGVAVKTPSLDVVARSVGVFLQFQKVTVDDIMTARQGIEPFAVGRLAAKRNPKVISALEALADRAETSMGGSIEFAATATAFHHAVVALAGNKTLSVLHDALMNIIDAEFAAVASRYVDAPPDGEKRVSTVRAYRQVLKLIKAGDAAGAERYWSEHLRSQTKMLLIRDHGKLIIDLFAPPGGDTPTFETSPAPSSAPPASAGRPKSAQPVARRRGRPKA